MRFLQAILITLLLTSCSAQWHIKRAIKKDPSIITDTVIFDTVVIREERVLRDTFLTTEYDTITMEDSFVYTQVIREKDIIKVYTKCKADTIRITKKLPPQVIYKEPWFKWWYFLIIFAIFVIIIKLK